MRRIMGRWCALALVLAGSAGCGTARVVQVDPDGGVVAIPSNSNSWPTYYRDKADALMREKCPGGYEVVREGEFVTGTVAHTNSRTDTQQTPTLLLGGASGSSQRTGRGGERHSASFGGFAVPLGPTQQTTHETTTYRDVKEWRIHYRAKKEPGPPTGGPSS